MKPSGCSICDKGGLRLLLDSFDQVKDRFIMIFPPQPNTYQQQSPPVTTTCSGAIRAERFHVSRPAFYTIQRDPQGLFVDFQKAFCWFALLQMAACSYYPALDDAFVKHKHVVPATTPGAGFLNSQVAKKDKSMVLEDREDLKMII